MKKTIQYQNPKLVNKDKPKQTVSTGVAKQIPLSVIVPVKENGEHIGHFVETIKKIKQENYSRFELIVVNNNASQEVLSTIETNDFFKTLKEQNLIKIINTEGSISKTKAIHLGICNATKENVLVFDIDKLTNSFNINDLFSVKKDLTEKIGIPVFQAKEKSKKSCLNYSLLIAPLGIAKLLYSNLLPNDTKYQVEIKYKINQMGIEVEELTIPQSNPYGNAKPFHICTRIFRTCLSRINWFFISPLKELKLKQDKDIQLLPDKLKESSIYRFAFAVLAAVLFFLIPIMSYHAGNSGDEDKYQYPQALKIAKFYTTFGADTTYKNSGNVDMEGMRDYGMSFDTFTAFFNNMFHVDKVFEARHAMNGMVGWLAILFCGLLAFRLANWRAGLITMFLMFFSPPFLGQCLNNPKDAPFAMSYIFTIYYIVRFLQQFPKPTKKISFYVALGIAMAISIRIGGLLLIAYLVMFVALYYIFILKLKLSLPKMTFKIILFKILSYFLGILIYTLFSYFLKENYSNDFRYLPDLIMFGICMYFFFKNKFIIIVYLIIIIVVGYFMGLLIWPYALEAPMSNPFKTLSAMTNFSAGLRQIYEGVSIWSDKVPSYYTIKYVMITAPIVVLIGALLYIFTIRKKNMGYFWAMILLFSFGFPIFYIAYKHSNVYGGWRHALFTYPALVVVAGLGFNRAISFIKNRKLQFIGLIAIALLAFSPISHTIKNHPYEYVYFNEIEGGVKKAYGNYEMDYYFHSLREASEWIKENAKKDDPNNKSKIKVGAWLTNPLHYYFRHDTAKFEIEFVRYYERGNSDWDYAIFVNTGIDAVQLRNGTFPPANTVHTINVDGKPICIILKRTDKNDMLGFMAKEKSEQFIRANQQDSAMTYIQSAITYFKKAIDVLPTNEAALYNLADVYSKIKQVDSADLTIKKLLSFDPDYDNGLFSQALIYSYKQDANNVLKTCDYIVKNNYKFYMAHLLAANVYMDQQNAFEAEKELLSLIDLDRLDDNGQKQLLAIYKSQGMDENDAVKRLYKVFGDSFKKRGNIALAEEYYGHMKGN